MKIVNIRNSTEFSASEAVDVVSRSIQAGSAVNYSCRRGICGQCTGLVTKGEFAVGIAGETQVIAHGERPATVLMCQTFPRADLTIDCPDKGEISPTRAAQILSIAFPTPEVAVVELRLLNGGPFVFEAGQFLAIRWIGDRLKYFSIASPAQDSNVIQLHIRRQLGGEFTTWLFEDARPGEILGVDGPFGSFVWATPETKPVILMATGTGFSAIKSLIETHKLWRRSGPVYFYWGGQTASDAYNPELAEDWAKKGSNFRFIAVSAVPSEGWTGRIGYLQDSVVDDHVSLHDFDVYACGSPTMIERARSSLTGRGLPPERFFTDSFNATPAQRDADPGLIRFIAKFGNGIQGQITAESAVTLLQVLKRSGLHIDHYCGGGAVCGTCRVVVEPRLTANINIDEAELLDCIPNRCEGHRLSCQFSLSEELNSRTIYLPGTPGHVSDLRDWNAEHE
jgi:CDP-4-dehydro-6-deoxyglucose reductase, E3